MDAIKSFIHWLGHVLIGMDCAVRVDAKTQRLFCKKCGRDVSDLEQPHDDP